MMHGTLARGLLRPIATLILIGTAVVATAQSQAFKPFDGTAGYQELAISADTYYLSFHGNRDTSGPWVKVAWSVRAAQLCASKRAEVFVALRYIEEAVLPGDAAMAELDTTPARLIPVAGAPIYVPIIVPSGPRFVSVDAPGKAGPVRCLAPGAKPLDPNRVVRVADALEAGRVAGVPVQ